MIIAIDGPAGSGKSTVAKKVARMMGFHYLDTGAMYRCIARRALDTSVAFTDTEALEVLARECTIAFEHEPGNPIASEVILNGQDVTDAIRTAEVDAAVSKVAGVAGVRDALVVQQRAIAADADIVMEGRDIGTVVFPGAELKIFLTASAEERARRRAAQNAERGFGETDADVLLADIVARDDADSQRDVSPLKAAEDAIDLDTTGMDIEQVCARIVELAQERA